MIFLSLVSPRTSQNGTAWVKNPAASGNEAAFRDSVQFLRLIFPGEGK
jgi:hypothetical protein